MKPKKFMLVQSAYGTHEIERQTSSPTPPGLRHHPDPSVIDQHG